MEFGESRSCNRPGIDLLQLRLKVEKRLRLKVEKSEGARFGALQKRDYMQTCTLNVKEKVGRNRTSWCGPKTWNYPNRCNWSKWEVVISLTCYSLALRLLKRDGDQRIPRPFPLQKWETYPTPLLGRFPQHLEMAKNKTDARWWLVKSGVAKLGAGWAGGGGKRFVGFSSNWIGCIYRSRGRSNHFRIHSRCQQFCSTSSWICYIDCKVNVQQSQVPRQWSQMLTKLSWGRAFTRKQ